MRRLLTFVAVLVLVASVNAQDKTWKKTLEAKLAAEYPPTKINSGFFQNGIIKDPGVVVVVQQPGISADNGNNLTSSVTNVQNGKVANARSRAVDTNDYILKVGDKLYVRDFSVGDNEILARLVTTEMIEKTVKGTTDQRRFNAIIRFQFDKGYLPTADFVDIKKAIAPVISTADQLATTNQKTIELGQTIEQVEATFGKPATVIKLGTKTIYSYKDIKVTFTDGKVSDVQ